MNGLKVAQEKIAQCKTHKISYLDFSDLGLHDIPESIKELNWLEALSLSNKKLISLEPIGTLTNLHKLSF